MVLSTSLFRVIAPGWARHSGLSLSHTPRSSLWSRIISSFEHLSTKVRAYSFIRLNRLRCLSSRWPGSGSSFNGLIKTLWWYDYCEYPFWKPGLWAAERGRWETTRIWSYLSSIPGAGNSCWCGLTVWWVCIILHKILTFLWFLECCLRGAC